jgi:hypothetical protein
VAAAYMTRMEKNDDCDGNTSKDEDDKQIDHGSVGAENDLANQEANESVISNRFMS